MPCYSPLRGVIRSPQGLGLAVPCGRCIGCRLERARQWAVRIVHESKMHKENSFLTLTYCPEHLPKDGSLSVEVCQKFLKRLRERLRPLKIRFFLCGEYGEKVGRPHYHAIIFGYGFPDRKFLKGQGELAIYTSKLLSECWPFGHSSVGAVTFDSASYVANYATKKIVGDKEVVDGHYKGRRPEFLLMSRRPGIGRSWIEKFFGDVYPSDQVIVRGVEARPPRYYDGVLESRSPAVFESIKARRSVEAGKLESFSLGALGDVLVAPANNMRRLKVREVVARAKLSLKRSSLEV